MKITVFQSDKGDCLLLEGSKGTTILADGGMIRSYNDHVAPRLNAFRKQGRALDLVYVSHIDEDHISGILQMMDDEVAWRIYEHHKNNHHPKAAKFKPRNPRPPEVKELWHNVFHDTITQNRGDLEDLLIASMKTTLVDPALDESFQRLDSLVNSERQALLLKHRLDPSQLGIPINKPTKKKLMFIGSDGTVRKPIKRKELEITVIGPRKQELDALRTRWNRWVRDNRETIRRVRDQARIEGERLHSDEAVSFQDVLGNLAAALGDRSSVTPPNLASLMLVVKNRDKRALLTGDSHPDDIRAGLKEAKLVDGQGRAHFDVIKVQHHGSEHNMDEDFCENITADHYVFCGDGSHENPDLRVVDLLIRKRAGLGDESGGFKLWFNCSEAAARGEARQKHMAKLEKLVRKRADSSGGRLKCFFLDKGSSFSLTL